jgi:hypothetical protein
MVLHVEFVPCLEADAKACSKAQCPVIGGAEFSGHQQSAFWREGNQTLVEGRVCIRREKKAVERVEAFLFRTETPRFYVRRAE